MTHRKSQPKERYVRQRATREARRALAAINPSICHPQQQSPFFAKLPAEIRFQIYQLAISQQWDLSKPIDKASVPPRYRPGHTHHTCISTTLLRTCRLVYCEAHAIPMRSFSHHCRRVSSFTRSFGSSDYLYDITKQQGAELYHLHSHLNMWQLESFRQFLQPHYCWRRITWTVHIERISGYLPSEDAHHIVEALERVVLPASCHEVNLELETRVGIKGLGPPFMLGRPHAEQHTDVCKSLALKKTDGTVLQIDPTSSVGYSWTLPPLVQSNYSSRLYTSRLCWRDEVPRRMYTGYDLLDCLRIQGTRCEIEEIHPLV